MDPNMSTPHRPTPRETTRPCHALLRAGLPLLALALLAVAPLAAAALPVTYGFQSGSVTIRGNLAGQTATIFEGPAAVAVPILSVTAVYDDAIGANGRLESFSLTAADLSLDLDAGQVGLDSLEVFGPTISSLSGSDLNVFGQFALPTQLSAEVVGTFPDGSTVGPIAVQSSPSTGSATGVVALSGDQILISVVGVTIASFPPTGVQDPLAPAIEIKADFTFIGRAVANPIPEPGASLLFAAGLATAALRRGANARP